MISIIRRLKLRFQGISEPSEAIMFIQRTIRPKDNFVTFSSAKDINLKKYHTVYEGHGRA
jgi:hypothetical protein